MHRDFVSPIKSIGHGITCNADLENGEEVWKVILELSQDIGHRLRFHELEATGVQIAVRSNDLMGQQYQCKLTQATRGPMVIARKARELFEIRYSWRSPVRAITIRAIDLVPQGQPQQLTLFIDQNYLDKLDKLDGAIEEIRRRFGKRAVFSASLLGDLKMPNDGRDKVVMPSVMYS